MRCRLNRPSLTLCLLVVSLVPALSGCQALCELLGINSPACDLQLGSPTATSSNMVEIEIRFISLSDAFFERIGVDFDINLDEQVNATPFDGHTTNVNTPTNALQAPTSETGGPANGNVIVPSQMTGNDYLLPTVPINASASTVNFFPNVPNRPFDLQDPSIFQLPDLNSLTGGIVLEPWTDSNLESFGFAILSDIEVFLLAVAADNESDVLEAPKVTLFNGQAAAVITSDEPTLVPDLLSNFREQTESLDPQIQTVQSGPMLDVQAVISADRRFITMNIVPIRAIQVVPNLQASANGAQSSILLPIFQFANVQTTVSVPDGGTILLGGQTLTGGTQERGVPILNKLPYVNRLFRNTGTFKDERNLLVMITPRILIQEEEEAN